MKDLWLTTGITGELGSQLRQLCEPSATIELKPLDLNQKVSAQTILHLAARLPKHSLRQQIESNLIYLHQVLRYAERNGVGNFIFLSTASVYSQSKASVLREEDVAFSWRDTYSLTKWLGEKLVARAQIPNRLILRIPALLEERSASNFISRAAQQIANGEAVNVTHFDKPFNKFISAEEILRFAQFFVSKNLSLQTLNLAPAATHSLKDVLQTVASSQGKDLKFKPSQIKTPHSVLSTARAEALGFTTGDALTILKQWKREN